MVKEEWMKRVVNLVGEASGDQDLNDQDFIEVMQELEDQAGSAWRAKQEELDKE